MTKATITTKQTPRGGWVATITTEFQTIHLNHLIKKTERGAIGAATRIANEKRFIL